MGVEGDDDAVTVFDVATEVFDLEVARRIERSHQVWIEKGEQEERGREPYLISVVVGGGNLDRSGAIEDDGSLLLLVLSLEPSVLNSVANLHRELGFSLRESFGRVLELPLGLVPAGHGLVDEFSDELDMPDGEVDRLLLRVLEDLVSEERSRGVVHVENDIVGVTNSLESSSDELLSSGTQDLES